MTVTRQNNNKTRQDKTREDITGQGQDKDDHKDTTRHDTT